jgi:hypothetical protein
MADFALMILVVDRNTRRVVDCESLDYSWKMDEVVKRHDLDKVDLVIRERQVTKPTAIADSFVETDVETPRTIREDEDIPF